MDELKFLFEIVAVSFGGALVKIVFTTEPIPLSRQFRVFAGSFILSVLFGYSISQAALSRAWYIGSIVVSALLGETIIKVLREQTPAIITKLIEKYLNIK